MRNVLRIALLGIGSLLAWSAHAQHQCSAAFLDGKIVVDQYTPTGKCQLAASATGELTVQTANLSIEKSIPVDKIDFQVAIRDKASGTLTLYSGETYRQVPVQKVLANCKKGDHIVLLTLDKRYALPHNEILVQ